MQWFISSRYLRMYHFIIQGYSKFTNDKQAIGRQILKLTMYF